MAHSSWTIWAFVEAITARSAAIALVLFLSLSSAATSSAATESPETLDQLIQVGLDFPNETMNRRQAALDKARTGLANSNDKLPRLRAEFGLAYAYLNYQKGKVDEAIEAIRPGLSGITATSHPNLYVRLQSLLGGLLLTAGKGPEGLKTLELLFAQNFAGVDQKRIENARVNYASGLRHNGRINEASRSYEQTLTFALSANEDLLGLSAGSNYISLLRDQGMSAQAQYWLERLRPAMQRQPNTMAAAALMLYDYALILDRGGHDEVAQELQQFLASSDPLPNLVRAHAEELNSEALLAQRKAPEALAAAERALALLESYPLEQPEAIMAITRALLALENYSEAGEKLKQLALLEITRPANTAELNRLRTQHALGTNNNEAASKAFADFVASNEKLADFVNNQQTDHYQKKLNQQLEAQQNKRELERAREDQARLSTEAALQKAEANEAKMRAASLTQQRGTIVGALILVTLFSIALIQINARRQLHSRLRQSLRQQNKSLAELVERKSEDLVKNITDQSQLKEALAERRHMEAIGQISGHVAHDFNNVLQVISSANELLAKKVKTEVEKSALNASSQSVRSASSRARQLLAYSRNQQLEASVFSVSEYLRDTSSLFRSAVGDVNELTIDDQSGDAALKLDSGQLTAAIINLLRNSADAMETPGEITLSAKVLPAGEQLLQLQVTDQGRGMDAKELEQAAHPYYTTKQEGTGLGLSSVHGFAIQSGGEVLVDSKVGVGTRVSLRFMLHDLKHEVESVTQSPSTISLRNSRVLLVEDNDLVASTLLSILEREGAKAHWVDSTQEAQRMLLEDSAFDLVLSDVKVPGPVDGFGLAKWIRTNFPDVAIGMMSGYGPSNDNELNFPVLSKPFKINELLDFLNKNCEVAVP